MSFVSRCVQWTALLASLTLIGCSAPEKIIGENWRGPGQTPPGQDFTPEAAINQEIEGLAILRCIAGPNREGTNCRLIVEAPMNWGFGAAALKMGPGLRAADTRSVGGGPLPPVGGAFVIPVQFCPARDPDSCRQRLTQATRTYVSQYRTAMALFREGQCESARLAAHELGPVFERDIALACRPAEARR